MRATVVYSEPESVASALKRLRAPQEALLKAVVGALQECRNCHALDAVTMPGIVFWNAGIRILREELMSGPQDRWRPVDDHIVPLIVDVERAVAITFACGTSTTGDPDSTVQPTTRRPRGPISAGIIHRNPPRLFEGAPRVLPTPKADARLTWYLLACPSGNKATCELSYPMKVQGGRIVEWHERIILPTVTLNQSPTPNRRRGDAPRIEVRVVRKA